MKEKVKENVLMESLVTSDNYRGNVQVVLTNEKIIIKKKKGLFKKVYKEIDNILLKDIKVVNDEVMIKNKNCLVEIKTVIDSVSFKFTDNAEAKKFVGRVIDTTTGTSFIKRVSTKVKNAINTVDDVIGKENRKSIVKALGSTLLAVVGFIIKKKN